MNEETISLILIGLPITAFMYMVIPLLKFCIAKEEYSIEEIKKFNKINSIVVFISDCIICLFISEKFGSLYPPFIYYYLNNKLWIEKLTGIQEGKNFKETLIICFMVLVIITIISALLLITFKK